VVSKSQTGQLLDLLEQIGTGSLGEITITEKTAVTQEAKLSESEIYRETIEDGLSSNNTNLSSQEADELFSLCRDIQELVDGSDNTLKELSDDNVNVVSLLQEIPEEVTKVSSKKDFIDIDSFFKTTEISCSNSSTSEDCDLNALLEDEVSYSSKNPWDDDFLDLFPSLASV